MSLQDLQSVLQQQADGPQHAISVSAATITSAQLTPEANFDQILERNLVMTAPLSVAVSQSIPPHSGNTLSVDGTATILGVANVAVTVTFVLAGDNQTVDVLLIAPLPGNWILSSSFPLLVGFPFADLTLSNGTYLLTTATQSSYTFGGQQLNLTQGLNLAANLALGGPLQILQAFIAAITPQQSIVFAGTVNPTAAKNLETALPQLNLSGIISQPITAKTPFSLGAPSVLLTSALDSSGHLAYWLTFSTELSVNGTPFSSFEAAILQNATDLMFALVPVNKAITPADISKLIAGTDFTQYIPPVLQEVFSGVGLTGLSVAIATNPISVEAIGASIGTKNPWTMGQFTVESLALNCQVFDPFTENQSVEIVFTASASIFKNIFDRPFTFEIDYDVTTKALTIAATFQGTATISISQLVSGLSDNTIQIPSNLASIAFTDFGMTFTSGSGADYEYTLYGKAEATFNIDIVGNPIVADFEINVDSSTKTYLLIGGLTLGNSFFAVSVNLSGSKQVLSGSWQALHQDYLGLSDILTALKLPAPQNLPSDLDLALESASITWDITDDTFLITAQSANYGSAIFAIIKVDKNYQFYFLLGVNKTFSLSNLPLVGKELASIENIQIGQIQAIVGSANASEGTATIINNLIATDAPGGGYPTLPAAGTTARLLLEAQAQFGSQNLPINLSLGGKSNQQFAGPPSLVTAGDSGQGQVTSTTTPDGATWFTVQKSFGPVTIQRIGALYQTATQSLWFELDASLAFGPLALSLMGLGIGSPVTSFNPQFSLGGLGISYSEPPLTIAGELVNLAPPGADYIEFEGGVVIGTGEFTVQAFGFYGNNQGFNSMFIFGDLAYPFGGPPAFFVTGVALGFGYNSALKLPTIDQVATFPFVQVLPSSTIPNTGVFGGSNPAPLTVLNKILADGWVTEQQGNLWFAAGITFTSFELVNSQALIIVETGSELVIALIGTSRAQFPQGESSAVYAYIELDLLLRFAPSEGVFSLQAVLASTSFLLDKACVLTGGFAFFVWFGSNPHAGDFVITLGGYNPGFTPPSYYPATPPVGFHWTMDSSITIQGGAYFALTPAAVMVGGALNATFQAGNLKAWFNAHADVIIRWKPFWFDAGIGLTVGASYKVDLLFTSFTVTVELGCDLEFWGPETGGTVRIDWYIISFTIPFGTPKNDTQKISGWSDVEAMLPNASSSGSVNVLNITPGPGLTPNGTKPVNSGGAANRMRLSGAAVPSPCQSTLDNSAWVVRGGEFSFSTSTPIPASTLNVGSTNFAGSNFNVYPLMQLNQAWKGVSATHTITVTAVEDGKDWSAAFEVSPVSASVPASLWGSPPVDGQGKPQVPSPSSLTVPDQLVGASLQVLPPVIGNSAGPVGVQQNLANDNLKLPGAVLPVNNSATPTGDQPVNSGVTISTIANPGSGIASKNAASARLAIFNGLSSLGYAPPTNDPMSRFTAAIGCSLNAEPLLVP
jgi:hypothetical protein